MQTGSAMKRARLPLGLIAASAIALGAGYACQDDGGVGPGHEIVADVEPGPIGTYSVPTPPGNVPGVASQASGIILPVNLPIKVTVSGMLTFTANPAFATCFGQPGPEPPWGSTLGPAGWDATPRTYAVTLAEGSLGSTITPQPLAPQGGPRSA